MQARTLERVRERTHDVFLSDERSEILRSPLACENLIGHREIVSATTQRPISHNSMSRDKAAALAQHPAMQQRRVGLANANCE
jgi:hypothetical protein